MRILVGVLHRYSKSGVPVQTLGQLGRLPQRQLRDHPPARTAKLIRQPTSNEEARIAADYLSGHTINDIAADLQMHRTTISATLHRAGIPTRYHQRTTVDLDRADQLLADGLTITEAAKVLSVGRTTLVQARRDAQ
jgi:AraC-like DNA-binding protein